MSDSPSSPTLPAAPQASGATLESLLEAQRALRMTLHVTLFMLLLLTGSLFVFFRWELTIARRQIDELSQAVADYEKNTAPNVEKFRKELQSFAQTHPDFGPIYSKYFRTNAAEGGNASGGARLPPR